VQVAPVGDNLDALFVGIREFPTKKIVLLAPTEKMTDARELEKRLAPFRVPVQVMELRGTSLLEKMFESFASLKRTEGEDDLIVNVATGDRISTCAALSASYVNGIRAFSVMENEIMLLPMLKFSFSKLISEKKTEIITAVSDGASKSFEEIQNKMKMSAPLLSYHLNGDRETSGLIELGLVEILVEEQQENEYDTVAKKKNGSGKRYKLSSMGMLFFKGYCQP
jgi:hypothetical protein